MQAAETHIVSPEDIPTVMQDDGFTARVLIGNFAGQKSPAKTWAADVVCGHGCIVMNMTMLLTHEHQPVRGHIQHISYWDKLLY